MKVDNCHKSNLERSYLRYRAHGLVEPIPVVLSACTPWVRAVSHMAILAILCGCSLLMPPPASKFALHEQVCWPDGKGSVFASYEVQGARFYDITGADGTNFNGVPENQLKKCQ